MHDEEGPRRLRQGTDTPEPLLRALAALRKGVDDTARLERVGQKLEAAMNAAPAAEGAVAAGRGLMGNKLSTLKLIVGGLGLLAPLLFFQFMNDATVPPSSPEGSPQPSAAAEKLAPVETAQPLAEETSAPLAVAPEPTAAPVATHAAKPHVAAMRPRKQRVSAANVQAHHDQPVHAADDVVAFEPSTLRTEPEAVAAVSDISTSTPPKASKEKAQPRADAPPAVSEASLLLQARQALKSDPARTLTLATEHQTRFASGRLTPEREVLAIEALRKLGRAREADERLRQFEAQYPGSIHLKRLHEKR